MMTILDLKDQNLILFECISGSRAYGLNTPESDTDIKGVFYLPKKQFYGLEYIPQVSNETNDEVYYELGRFVDLLVKNNPNLLETLASPADCILQRHPIMDNLKLDMFLSKLSKNTFAGYAMTQIQKARGLNKKIVNPMLQERKDVLDFCYILQQSTSIPLKDWLSKNTFRQENCGLVKMAHAKSLFALFYDSANEKGYKGVISNLDANEVCLSSISGDEKISAYLYFNVDRYSLYCKEYKEYWEWVGNRNENRYRMNQEHGKDYDSKNMMHVIRLLEVAEEIMKTNQLQVRRSNRDELLSIKRGEWLYDDILNKANRLIESIDAYYEQSSLPESPNKEMAEQILIKMREELYA